MTSKKRRHYGTGNVSQRANGKWVGRFDAGYTRTGHRKLSELTAADIRKIHTAMRKADKSRPPPSAPTTSSRRSSRTHAATATPSPPVATDVSPPGAGLTDRDAIPSRTRR